MLSAQRPVTRRRPASLATRGCLGLLGGMQVQSHPDGVAAGPLGRVQRRVGDLEQPVEVRGVVEERPPTETLRSPTVSGPSAVATSTPRASTRRRIRSATAPVRRSYPLPSCPGSMITNSSPPNRPTRSLSRTSARSASATEERTRSPARWPWRSLTSLKWSRSRMSTAAPPWLLRPLQHPVGLVLPRRRVEQAGLPVDARDLLEVPHEDCAVEDDQRRQHQQRVQRARRGDGSRGERAHRQRRELEDDLVPAAEHLAERALRR